MTECKVMLAQKLVFYEWFLNIFFVSNCCADAVEYAIAQTHTHTLAHNTTYTAVCQNHFGDISLSSLTKERQKRGQKKGRGWREFSLSKHITASV